MAAVPGGWLAGLGVCALCCARTGHEPCGFFEFKSHDELIPLWEAHGDPDVATWDMGRDSKPRAVAD